MKNDGPQHQHNDQNLPQPLLSTVPERPVPSLVPDPPDTVEIAGKYTEGSYGPAGIEPGIASANRGSYTTSDPQRHTTPARPVDPVAPGQTAESPDPGLEVITEPLGRYTEGEYGSSGSVDAALSYGPAPHYTHSAPHADKRHRKAHRHP